MALVKMGNSAKSYGESLSSAVAKNVIAVALGLIINYINGTLINTFRKHQQTVTLTDFLFFQIFYLNPRYILFIHLVLNDMLQLTVTISLLVFSYFFYKINASFCCLLITFAVFTTFNTPLNLAVMAVECYIAISLPLRHADFCTIKRTYILIGWIWAMSAVSTLPDVFIVMATEPARLFHSTIFCERDNLFRHPISLKKRDVSYIISLIGVWLTIFYTYFKIFFAAKAAKEDGDATKARNTILLHGFQLLLCMLTYIGHIVRKKNYAHATFVSYIFIQVLPRFISPIVYGLRDKTFRHHLKKHLLCTVRTSIKPWTRAKFMLLC
ncbi:odorant receptor 131-2-like [Scophthalmus maximus]|uniref:odorant receptor 131-2-like n=1 Tax=Scophthalmus maximus TaxID=52904 RepID=UPI001FA8D2CC|nr:odorant receptor 131-2-like [Scophthalmus maximus]